MCLRVNSAVSEWDACKFINAKSFLYHSIALIGCAPFAFSPFDNSMDISRYPGVTIIYNMYSLKKKAIY